MFRRFINIAAFVCIPIAGTVACGSRGIVMGEDTSPPAEFVSADSGTADGDVGADELMAYCPSSQCPPGWTTCPDSRFPCDTNILADSRNCGGCGMACPPNTGWETFVCNAGECKMECDNTLGSKDCDGLVDNGCETNLLSTTTCGGCNVVCDPGQSCAVDFMTKQIKCMCAPGQKNCGTAQNPACVDIANDVFNCGGCGITCNAYFTASGLSLSHFVTACDSGSCSLGCERGWADCNGRLDDGCEVDTNADPENCGGCGIVCDGVAGQACVGGRCALEPCDVDGPGAK